MADKTKKQLEAELEAARAELENLKNQMNKTAEAEKVEAPAPAVQTVVQPQVVYAAPVNTDVTLVYTSDSLGVVNYTNGSLSCTRYGEEFILPRYSFDEIVGKYRSWFDKGILAVSDKDVEVARAKGIPTVLENGGLTYTKLNKMGEMSPTEIEALWNSVSREGLKISIVSFFKRKYEEGAPGFDDMARIDTLDRLSGGGMEAIRSQARGKNYIPPKDLMGNFKDTLKVL